MANKAHVKSEATVKTFVYLRAGASNALEQAKANQKGSFYNKMTSMLCCAFSLEAFFNHIGYSKITFWDSIERNTSPEGKLNVIADLYDIKIDYGKRPFSTFKEIIAFRNKLAHGKTETVNYEKVLKLQEEETPPPAKTKWQEPVNIKNASRFLEDTKEVMKIICQQCFPQDWEYELISFGGSSWEVNHDLDN